MLAKHNRILMLLENNPYPHDARVRREAETLTCAGYDVTVIAPRRRNQAANEIVRGVRVLRYPAPADGQGALGFVWEYGYSLVATFVLTLKVCFTHGFDVIHAHNPPDLYVLIAALFKPFGKKFVFDHHDLSPEMYDARFRGRGNGFLKSLLLAFEKLSCRLADLVIATNQSYQRVEMERGKVTAERSAVVRNGPDLDRVRLVEEDPGLRARAGAIIGYVGVMGYQDGIDYLIRALHHLKQDLGYNDFFCVLVGKGDAQRELNQLVQQLGLADHVWFTGFVSDEQLVRYLSTADIMVDPDPHNDFNDRSTMIKMMEYMALSKPIVAFDLTEHRVTAGDAALYAKNNDELDFARQIARLMDDAELRRHMGQKGYRRVVEELAWPYQAERLVSAYGRLGLTPTVSGDETWEEKCACTTPPATKVSM